MLLLGVANVCAMDKAESEEFNRDGRALISGPQGVVVTSFAELTSSGRSVMSLTSVLDEKTKSLISSIFAERNRLSRECESFSQALTHLTKICNDRMEKVAKIENMVDSLEAELRALDATKATLIAEHAENNAQRETIYLTMESMKKEGFQKLLSGGRLLAKVMGLLLTLVCLI